MQAPSRLVGPKSFGYDVIICCAKDTSEGFTGFLVKDLKDRAFSTIVVVDHWEQLKREVIEGSRVIIIVLSLRFIDCQSRLDKFSQIVNEFDSQRILPVFYHVSPSEVRYQIGSYELPMDIHKIYVEPERFTKWINAFTKVADFGGWPLTRSGNKFEFQCIEEICQKVSEHVACSVGLQRRVQRVHSLLYSGPTDGVRFVGIYGEPGAGKTVICRELCHSNANKFDCCFILDKVGDNFGEHGLEYLERELVREIFGNNLDEGWPEMLLKLDKKSVLVIFEDIYQGQLEVIVTLTDWLSSGSKVIFTSEMKCALDGIEIYEVERFSKGEAYELLSLRASKSRMIHYEYSEILPRAATCAGGLPYFLELIGSSWAGKRIEECESIVDQYEKISDNTKKQRMFQTCFDGLGKDQQKILISIALDLKGKELATVEKNLHYVFGVCRKEDIKVLLDKCLIKINGRGHVTVHDLTQDMIRDNFAPQYHSQTRRLQLIEGNTEEYGEQEIQPSSSHRSIICNLTEEVEGE